MCLKLPQHLAVSVHQNVQHWLRMVGFYFQNQTEYHIIFIDLVLFHVHGHSFPWWHLQTHPVIYEVHIWMVYTVCPKSNDKHCCFEFEEYWNENSNALKLFPLKLRKRMWACITSLHLTCEHRINMFQHSKYHGCWWLGPFGSAGHQHPWYWQRRIGNFLPYLRRDFNHLFHVNMEFVFPL